MDVLNRFPEKKAPPQETKEVDLGMSVNRQPKICIIKYEQIFG